MATLWWDFRRFSLSEVLGSIGPVRLSIASKLSDLGYKGVEMGEDIAGDVHGFKGDFILAVRFLPVGGRDYWQGIACGGSGTVDGARAEVNEVAAMIEGLTWL